MRNSDVCLFFFKAAITDIFIKQCRKQCDNVKGVACGPFQRLQQAAVFNDKAPKMSGTLPAQHQTADTQLELCQLVNIVENLAAK